MSYLLIKSMRMFSFLTAWDNFFEKFFRSSYNNDRSWQG